MRRLLVLTTFAILSGCGSNEVQLYGSLDTTEKTIAVPPGNRLMLGPIKQALHDDAWKVTVEGGPARTVGTLGEKTDLTTVPTFKARYRLAIRQAQFDVCVLRADPAITYEMSVIDNRTGEEVLAANGRDCSTLAVRKVIKALHDATRQ